MKTETMSLLDELRAWADADPRIARDEPHSRPSVMLRAAAALEEKDMALRQIVEESAGDTQYDRLIQGIARAALRAGEAS
jgi:hypothetical protein